MKKSFLCILLSSTLFIFSNGFIPTKIQKQHLVLHSSNNENDELDHHCHEEEEDIMSKNSVRQETQHDYLSSSRRNWFQATALTTASLLVATSKKPPIAQAAETAAEAAIGAVPVTSTATPIPLNDIKDKSKTEGSGGGVIMMKTRSGLKYIDLVVPDDPNAPVPRYGQFCIIKYTAYLKLPTDKEKQKYDKDDSYVLTHGDRRLLQGLDEGLHTMKEGGTRRLIIPPKLGFVEPGLGPLPSYPWDRRKLSHLLDKMVEQRGGNLIYDVTLIGVMDNEADLGYWDDIRLTPEEFQNLMDKLNRGGPAATAAVEAAQEAAGMGDGEVVEAVRIE